MHPSQPIVRCVYFWSLLCAHLSGFESENYRNIRSKDKQCEKEKIPFWWEKRSKIEGCHVLCILHCLLFKSFETENRQKSRFHPLLARVYLHYMLLCLSWSVFTKKRKKEESQRQLTSLLDT